MNQDNVIKQIKEIARKYKVDRLVLFGSRARGDHSPVSDYDIAVFKKHLSPLEKAYFCNDIDEVNTLNKIDIVFVQDSTSDEMIMNITKDGVILYE